MTNEKSIERKISILDWGILLSVIVLLVVIYIPSAIWRQEVKDRRESRHRMTIINDAEQFYKELTGNYTTNGEELFSLVEAAMDSLIADTLFVGEQTIHLNNKDYIVNMTRGIEHRIDTTFSHAQILKKTFVDTIFHVTQINIDNGGLDTLHVNENEIAAKRENPFFQEVIGMEVTKRVEDFTDYLRDKYHLTPALLVCPLSGNPYYLEIDKSDPERDVFIVRSPVPPDYKESKYILFKYESGNHGEIVDGVKSWAEK